MITNNLLDEILIKPARKYNELRIVSGFASPLMASNHITREPNISIDLVVGMASKHGVSNLDHVGFHRLNSTEAKFSCDYVFDKPPVHIKSYIWLNNKVPKLAFTGSGNYSQNAFYGHSKESFAEDNPVECNLLFEEIKKNSINCLSKDVHNKIKFFDEIKKKKDIILPDSKIDLTVEKSGFIFEGSLILSLVTKTGEIQTTAGLNWGQRKGREPNQAYIPVPSTAAKAKFFPERARHFSMVTDDGIYFDCAIAQDGDKAIHTPRDNSQFGIYFRNRLGVPLGAPVTRAHLESYGRTDIEVSKINDETYYMDFSTGK